MDGATLFAHFSAVKDPRIERSKKHKLIDIIIIAICAVIADADGWEDIETFAELKCEWFKSFLELKGGIPSHDTFRRVFARMDPKVFQQSLISWIKSVVTLTDGGVIPIDGKTVRRSFDKAKDLGPLHLVSAWSIENQLLLGQLKVESHSNEIPAIKSLLELLDVKGCIVTIDAIGCQKEIAKKISEKKGDYVLSLKANQNTAYSEAELVFGGVERELLTNRLGTPFMTTDGDHGRIEERRYWISEDLSVLSGAHEWANLKALGIAEKTREIRGKTTIQRQFSLLSFTSVERFANAQRSHWKIENSLHWCLDVTFREDECRIRKGESPENFAMLRRSAISLLKNIDPKLSIRKKRYQAALKESYLLKLLGNVVMPATE